MSLVEFLVTKWLAFAAALLVIVAAWWLAPAALTAGFDLNLLWVNVVWGWIYGFLPKEVALSFGAVQQIYGGLVMALQAFTKLLPGTAALQTEAAVRAILGEGWLLLLEVSLAFRAVWVFGLRRAVR